MAYLGIITNARKSNASHLQILSKELHYLTINLVEKENFNHRFCIIDERQASVVGTSINSFGNKHFFIQNGFLSFSDTQKYLFPIQRIISVKRSVGLTCPTSNSPINDLLH